MPSIPTTNNKPKLVNRGPAGLLSRVPSKPASVQDQQSAPAEPAQQVAAPINKIAPSLEALIVDISSLTADPDNARLHPERNMEAICQSLQMYGQVKPVVVQKSRMKVVAGNGTMEGAIRLGWTKLAASIVEMTDVEAAGYGLADNRSAELAKWDFEVVARLDKLCLEAGHGSIGWSTDELEVLRAADWTPPVIDEEDGFSTDRDSKLLVSFTAEQHDYIEKAIHLIRQLLDDPKLDQADCLVKACQMVLEGANATDPG